MIVYNDDIIEWYNFLNTIRTKKKINLEPIEVPQINNNDIVKVDDINNLINNINSLENDEWFKYVDWLNAPEKVTKNEIIKKIKISLIEKQLNLLDTVVCGNRIEINIQEYDCEKICSDNSQTVYGTCGDCETKDATGDTTGACNEFLGCSNLTSHSHDTFADPGYGGDGGPGNSYNGVNGQNGDYDYINNTYSETTCITCNDEPSCSDLGCSTTTYSQKLSNVTISIEYGVVGDETTNNVNILE